MITVFYLILVFGNTSQIIPAPYDTMEQCKMAAEDSIKLYTANRNVYYTCVATFE